VSKQTSTAISELETIGKHQESIPWEVWQYRMEIHQSVLTSGGNSNTSWGIAQPNTVVMMCSWNSKLMANL
jgi:hypothetical protein